MARLTITRCELIAGKIEPLRFPNPVRDRFEVTINPESYARNFAIAYNGTGRGANTPIGKAAASPEYSRTEAETVSFSLVIDGTGVVEAARGKSVSSEVSRLRNLVYTYQGSEHEPSPVELNWGDELRAFRARLTEMSVDYTLFKPDGAPLRAKVRLSFIEALTPREVAVQADDQSPDMSHLVRVHAGDTLPGLCQKILKDPDAYLEIARANDLDGFRRLAPNTILRFPPMR
ncbi:MAG: peptidoglycan-binding protein [Roseovarius sp.]